MTGGAKGVLFIFLFSSNISHIHVWGMHPHFPSLLHPLEPVKTLELIVLHLPQM